MNHNDAEDNRAYGENPTERLDPTTNPTASYERVQQPNHNGAPVTAPEQQQLNPVYFPHGQGGQYGYPDQYGQGPQYGQPVQYDQYGMPFQGGNGNNGGNGYWGGNGGNGGNGGYPPVYGYPGGPGQYGYGDYAGTRKKNHGLAWGLGIGAFVLSLALGGVSGFTWGHNNGLHDGRSEAQSQPQTPNQGSNGQQTLPGQNGDGGSQSGPGDIENLPFNEYGDGQGNNAWGGQGSSITQGTKMTQGQPGFVIINTTIQGGRGAGTGLILDSKGTILTNYHVVEGSETVKVTDSTTKKTYDAQVLGRSKSKDVAVLKVKGANGLKSVDISKKSVKMGDSVSAIGNASGQGYLSKLDGKVTGTQQSITTRSESGTEGERLTNLIQTDADVVPGYSGGAFVNSKGQVVGVTTAASAGNSSATVDGYAIPIKDAMKIVDKVKDGDDSDGVQIGKAAALGISVLAADSGAVGGGYGVTVNGLLDDSPAADIGIKEGDTIVGLDGKSVKSFDVLKEILATHAPGDKVDLTWLDSSGKEQTKKIELGESSVN